MHRAKTGIEGSWKAYFNLLMQALESKTVTLQAIPSRKPLPGAQN
jgi:hypothetical protein